MRYVNDESLRALGDRSDSRQEITEFKYENKKVLVKTMKAFFREPFKIITGMRS